MICDYGCGQEAKHKFKNGKMCCGNNVSKCPSIKKIIGKSHKGMVISEKTIEAVRKSRLGKKDSIETRKKKSKARQGSKNPMFRKKHSKETRKKISLARLGSRPHNKLTIKQINEKYQFFSQIEEMRYNPDKPGEKEIQVHCKYSECKNSKENGGWFTPSLEQIHARKNNLENEGADNSNFYCSESCKNSCPLYGLKTDPYKNIEQLYTQEEYQIFRQEVLRRQREEYGNNFCEYCESKEPLHVHHEKPQKTNSIMILDPDNGVVFCKDCHYKIGHINNCSTGVLAKCQ